MNLIVQNPTDSSVIDGTWLDISASTPASSGSNYEFDNGIFNDEIETVSSRTWDFVPSEAFLSRTFSIAEEYNTGGVLLNRVTSNGSSRIHKLDSTTSGGITKQKFHGFVEGGYGEFVCDIILPMMAAEVAEWGLFNEAATQWNRNCWGNAFDLSGIVSRSSYSGGWTKERGGLLVTPRHIVIANHFQIGVGQQVQFIKKGASAALDEVITLTLSAGTRFPNLSTGFDNYIYQLSADVPAGINPIPYCAVSERAPGVMCGKYSDLVLKTSSNKSTTGTGSFDPGLTTFVNSSSGVYGSTYTRTGLPEHVAEWIPFFADYADFIRPILSGDSGSQHLVILSGTEVGFNSISSGASEASINEAILAVDAIAGVSTGYTVTAAPDPTL